MMKSSFSLLAVLCALLLVSSAHGFITPKASSSSTARGVVSSLSATSSSSSSSSIDQAVAIYDQNFPFGRAPPKPDMKKRLTDISEQQARATFSELVKLYGDDRALDMVKAMPICLSFKKDRFAPCLAAWGEIFGLEQAQDMVKRNPGLLAVRPDEAAKASESSMVFSYIVAFTRPAGPFLLALLCFAVLTPFIEALTGIQFGINH